MCGWFVLVDTIDFTKAEFNVSFEGDYEPKYNILVGQLFWVMDKNKNNECIYKSFFKG